MRSTWNAASPRPAGPPRDPSSPRPPTAGDRGLRAPPRRPPLSPPGAPPRALPAPGDSRVGDDAASTAPVASGRRASHWWHAGGGRKNQDATTHVEEAGLMTARRPPGLCHARRRRSVPGSRRRRGVGTWRWGHPHSASSMTCSEGRASAEGPSERSRCAGFPAGSGAWGARDVASVRNVEARGASDRSRQRVGRGAGAFQPAAEEACERLSI